MNGVRAVMARRNCVGSEPCETACTCKLIARDVRAAAMNEVLAMIGKRPAMPAALLRAKIERMMQQ